MKILMLVNNFPPEIGSAAYIFFELSKKLTNSGHKVTVVSTFPRSYNLSPYEKEKWISRYRQKNYLREWFSGVYIIRVPPFSLRRDNLVLRGIEHFIQPLILLVGALFSGRQDIILVYSPPPQLGLAGYFLSKMKNARLIVNIQDIYPECLVDSGILKKEKLIDLMLITIMNIITKVVYKISNYVTVHSDGNRKYLIINGVPCEKVIVIHNWVDVKKIKPMNKFNKYRLKYSFDDKFVITYAGIMSFQQDLETVIDAAYLLKEFEGITFLLVGDGAQKRDLVEKAERMRLNNVLFLPFQPVDEYPFVLGASDVCLVSLKKATRTPVVPKKLLDIMAAGRPVIANVPLNGDVPRITRVAKCGISVEPGKPEDLANAILTLYNSQFDLDELGNNGRKYAEQHFSSEKCGAIYENLFIKAVSEN